MSACPCGTGKEYAECCEPIITGSRITETAEGLMRSRYTAYVKAEVSYIIKSTHPDKQKDYDEKAIQDWSTKSDWLGFELINAARGQAEDNEGQIEFIAWYRQKGDRQKHHEIANFSKVDGKWYFVDSESPAVEQYVRETPKVGRNAPCSCGSGKKFKKCCGK